MKNCVWNSKYEIINPSCLTLSNNVLGTAKPGTVFASLSTVSGYVFPFFNMPGHCWTLSKTCVI